MTVELKIPSAGESITEVILIEWLKAEGEHANRDEPLALIETDKANVEVVAPADGHITETLKGAGAIARVGEVIGYFEPSDGAARTPPKVEPTKVEAPVEPPKVSPPAPEAKPEIAPVMAHPAVPPVTELAPKVAEHASTPAEAPRRAPPSIRRALREAEHSGAPVVEAKVTPATKPVPQTSPASASPVLAKPSPAPTPSPATSVPGREDEIVPMTPLRKRVAERLVEAQANAAMLTTFNEVDMSAVMELRKIHQESFKARHGVKLGFMSFFVKAVIEGLRAFPAVNAEIRGTDLVYHRYYDIGVAVGGGKGLVVPIIRNAERLGFADIEKTIADFGERAKAGRLKVEELQGGTFTISNGGVYGSMMSTPILNPPQSGILGMHAIQERAVVRNGALAIAPMMYVALTYDHRIIDGREAVSFLVRVKECIESPARMLLEV